LRVIAGTARGRRLKGPPDRGRGAVAKVRPSSDLVRGAMFSSLEALGASLARVLDLYAGTGALGIEALSRGGQQCDFVERDPAMCAVIRENLRLTGFDARARVYNLPVEKASARLHGAYTLVLADPPYADVAALKALETLAGSPLVQPAGTVLALEHSSREEPPGKMGELSLAKMLRHGDSAVSIYRLGGTHC